MQWFEMAGLSLMMVVLLGSVVAIVMRWFRHRERLAMIRQGLIPDAAAPPQRRRRRGLLLGGLVIAVLGLLLLCAAFFVAVPSLNTATTPTGLSSLGLIPLPGLLVAFMGVGLLILYVWAQPTVERRARQAAPAAPVMAELEPYEPEIEPWEAPLAEDAAASTLDAKAPSGDRD
jgi:hypothetical protein